VTWTNWKSKATSESHTALSQRSQPRAAQELLVPHALQQVVQQLLRALLDAEVLPALGREPLVGQRESLRIEARDNAL
jgi:hypothetical protein